MSKLMHLATLSVICLCMFMAVAEVRSDAPPPPPAGTAVDLLWGVKIPMRDGVHLNATVYKPKGMTEPLPVILTLTPYIADSYHEQGKYYARHGYVFAAVDSRGRGNSEGEFIAWENEGRDGYDAVEWLARQPWSNGKVAMWGGSYNGFVQWTTLKELPPHLATIVPTAPCAAGVDFPFINGIANPYEHAWATFTSGRAANRGIFFDNEYWVSKYRELFVNHVPFRDFGKLSGNPSRWFDTSVQHPMPDEYWRGMMPNAGQYRGIGIPILTITGAYDGDQTGALHYYTEHMKHGAPQVTPRHFLVIGPWDHAGTRTPKKEMGGVTFGEASLVDIEDLHRQWYDWVLKSGSRPAFLEDRVAYYEMGTEAWRYAENLESIGSARRALYLSSDGSAADVFHSGTLSETKPAKVVADAYRYDPLDIRPAELEAEDLEGKVIFEDLSNALTDQRRALNLFGSGLVYHSEPFANDTVIAGAPRLVLWIQMDVPDTDFEAILYEVRKDGTSIALTSDLLRARYRESREQARLVEPGAVLRYEFSSFLFFSRRIAKGSRLRLVFGAINSIYKQKNYNSGGVVADESAKDARTAHVQVYHGAEYPSMLELPLSQ